MNAGSPRRCQAICGRSRTLCVDVDRGHDLRFTDCSQQQRRIIDLALSDRGDETPQPMYEAQDKIIAKVATLYGILEQLGFKTERVEQCLRVVKALDLEDCLEWVRRLLAYREVSRLMLSPADVLARQFRRARLRGFRRASCAGFHHFAADASSGKLAEAHPRWQSCSWQDVALACRLENARR